MHTKYWIPNSRNCLEVCICTKDVPCTGSYWQSKHWELQRLLSVSHFNKSYFHSQFTFLFMLEKLQLELVTGERSLPTLILTREPFVISLILTHEPFVYFLSPVQLMKEGIEQLWWASGSQPGSSYCTSDFWFLGFF